MEQSARDGSRTPDTLPRPGPSSAGIPGRSGRRDASERSVTAAVLPLADGSQRDERLGGLLTPPSASHDAADQEEQRGADDEEDRKVLDKEHGPSRVSL